MASELEKLNKTLRRRRINRILRFMFICLVIAVLISVLTRIFLRVDTVSVENSSRYDSAEILSSCDDLRGKPILQFDRDLARESIETSLPYIKKISFSVNFPDKLRVIATPAVPAYSVDLGEVYVCLDKDYKVLEEGIAPFQGVLKVEGLVFESYELGKNVDLSENIEASVLDDLISVLSEHGLANRLTKIDFSKKYNLTFVLNDIIEVEFGTSEDFDKKTDMLIEILRRNPSDRRAVINVRNYDEGRYRALD
ncbi:MAG: FtsQ-type POTRA domain-containing protein [Clostridia bacterium]|nr:FtsQ-type POTRA domain-containing protein [Clostridia bacterium]